jgi:hypothetical protein
MIKHDSYFTYDELTAHLKDLVEAYSHLAILESIGQSHRGRRIWAVTLTDFSTGTPENKPGFYIEGATASWDLYRVVVRTPAVVQELNWGTWPATKNGRCLTIRGAGPGGAGASRRVVGPFEEPAGARMGRSCL